MRKAMVEGQDDECAPCVVDGYTCETLFHVGGIVAMCQAYAFGVGSGAAGVGDGGYIIVLQTESHAAEFLQCVFLQIFASHLHDLVHSYLSFFPGGLLVKHDDALHRGQLLANGSHLLELGSAHDDVLHVTMLHAEEQVVALLQFDAQGDVDGSGIEHGQFAHDPQVPSFGEECHAVSLAYSYLLQSGSQLVHHLLHLLVCGVGPFPAHLFHQESVVGIGACAMLKYVYNGFLLCHLLGGCVFWVKMLVL